MVIMTLLPIGAIIKNIRIFLPLLSQSCASVALKVLNSSHRESMVNIIIIIGLMVIISLIDK